MAPDEDLPWRTAAAALLSQFDDVASAEDVGAPGSQVRHDVDVATSDGHSIAVEVSRLLDDAAQETYRAFDRHGGRRRWAGATSWTIFTSDIDVHVKSVVKALRPLLRDLEQRGIESLSTSAWVAQPRGIMEDFDEVRELFEHLEDLRISAIERRPDDVDGRHLRIDVVDASVVVLAHALRAPVVTGDAADLNALADAAGQPITLHEI